MKSFLRSLVKDPLRKILALVFTLVLYWALNEGKQREDSIDGVQMHIVCDDDVFLPEKERSCAVRLAVRGSESIIKKLRAEEISGEIRITTGTPGFATGKVVLHFNPRDFSAPRGVEVIRVENPQEFTIDVQRKVTRSLPVKPEIFGRIPVGWVNEGVFCTPSHVTVSGPERMMELLQEVVTEPLNIDGETVSFSKKGLLLKNPSYSELTYNSVSTDVFVKMSRQPDAPRKLNDIPVRCLLPPQRMTEITLDKAVVSVTVSGSQSLVNRISNKDVMVFADFSDPKYAVPGEHLVQLQAVLNNADGKLRVTAIEPQEILIRSVSTEKETGKKK